MCGILQRDPKDPASELVAAANVAGGFDNITVVLTEMCLDGVWPKAEAADPSSLAETLADSDD